jgi:hypothetical protein
LNFDSAAMDAAAEKLERIIGFEERQILTVIFYG